MSRMTGLRVAWRRLRAAPGFLAASVATLALGMGANALVFSAVNGLLLRPLPFADGDRLVWLFAQNRQSAGERDTVSSEEGDALARRTSALATTAAIGDAGLVRELPSGHDRCLGIWATRSLAEVLRVHPVVGALPEELPAEGGPRAILVSYERWVRDFGSDPAIVGRRLDFADNKHFVVAGILPAGL